MGLFGVKHKQATARLHQPLDDAYVNSDQCARVLLRRQTLFNPEHGTPAVP